MQPAEFRQSKIFMAPNSALSNPFMLLPERPENGKGVPHILFVGRLQARKRLDLLFKACAPLPEESST